MHTYQATVSWHRGSQIFKDNHYSRAHTWEFDGGLSIPASSSPYVVPLPMSVAGNVDPEEALVAAASSCHMLFLLSIAAKRGFIIDRYEDQAYGVMGKNAQGKIAMTHITLQPHIQFSGERLPGSADLVTLHHDAHEQCYIANSLNTVIEIKPR